MIEVFDREGGRRAALGGVRGYWNFILSHVIAQSLSDRQCAATSGLKSVIQSAVPNCSTGDSGRGYTALSGKRLNLGYQYLSGHTHV